MVTKGLHRYLQRFTSLGIFKSYPSRWDLEILKEEEEAEPDQYMTKLLAIWEIYTYTITNFDIT